MGSLVSDAEFHKRMSLMVGPSAELENSGDFLAPTLAAEGLQRRSNPVIEPPRSSKKLTRQQKEVKDEVEKLGSSSSSEHFEEAILFSPGFRSAAAMAGWDTETLLIAALSHSPIDAGGGHDIPATIQEAPQVTRTDARKRDKHTPLSSARRHRRIRWEGSNGSPLGRLPMKPLTLLSDNELDSSTPSMSPSSVAVGKENCNPDHSTCKEESDLKGKGKERTPTKPFCLDQLREELSCAVCLDICFEPSTISCGHSFCATCLQSVIQNCGPRCPKCRQPVRGEALRNYRINTVLWNTIQILFPKESAARLKDRQNHRDDEAAMRALKDEENLSRRTLGTRPSRLQPWRSSAFFNNVSRISVMGNLRSSFQAASELMMPREDDSIPQQHSLPGRIRRDSRARQGTGRAQATEELLRSQSRSRRQNRATQEQVDAALAARLQQAELNSGSDVEELLVVEEPGEACQIRRHPTTRPRCGTVALTATSLRSVASRAVRQHRGRARS